MIIRLTVHDNDFGDLMDMFVRNLFSKMTNFPSNIEELDVENQLNFFREQKVVFRLLNPNATESHTEEEKTFLIKRVKESFKEFVEKHADSSTADYLSKGLEVEIVNSMEDKWENGEVWYWFQHSGEFLNQ